MKFKRPKGTNDIFGDEIFEWQQLEDAFRKYCSVFGIDEIRTPIFEFEDLFQRGVGETSDIVQKEMFSFYDRGNRKYVLKPEGTSGTARAYLENKLYSQVQPTKLFYISHAFRDERSQAGRFKQFHQFGVKFFVLMLLKKSYSGCCGQNSFVIRMMPTFILILHNHF